MVAAKLDQSRVLVTKFRPDRSTFKGRSASQRHTDRQTDKPVGFYSPIAPPVGNAHELRSLHDTTPPVQSEYPAERGAAAAVPLPESSQGHTSKSISSINFVGIESNFFTIHRRHRQKMMDQNFEIRIF